MGEEDYDKYHREHTPLISLGNALQHICENVECLSLFVVSTDCINTNFFKIKF